MINITHLTQKDRESILLNDINLTVPQKTVFGIFCEKKAERTALLEAISGACTDFDGDISICGHNIKTDRIDAQLLIGYMPEDMPFYNNMTVIEYLSFIADAKQLDFEKAQKNIKNILASTSLLTIKDAIISNLGPAGRVRLGIAQAMVSDPSVVLFGNPTYGLKKNETQEIFKLIRKLSRSKSVIITSDDPQALSFCDSGTVLTLGQLDTDIKKVMERGAK